MRHFTMKVSNCKMIECDHRKQVKSLPMRQHRKGATLRANASRARKMEGERNAVERNMQFPKLCAVRHKIALFL